jgi:ribosomal protein S18 acetylase RimI-like enzyme
MRVAAHADAQSFLRNAQTALESSEAVNSLMLGICGQLIDRPGWYEEVPCLRTVHAGDHLVLAALMTPPHNLIVSGFAADLDAPIAALVVRLLDEGWMVPGVLGPSDAAGAMTAAWGRMSGREFELRRRQQLYEARSVLTPIPERGRLRPATEEDAPVVSRWWYEFNVSIFGEADEAVAAGRARRRMESGDVFLWDDEGPVSLAIKTRPTRRGISVSMVYTPPQLRGRGYATACVGELSRLLLDEGREFCSLFADANNTDAVAVYRKIGYAPVCDFDEYEFL